MMLAVIAEIPGVRLVAAKNHDLTALPRIYRLDHQAGQQFEVWMWQSLCRAATQRQPSYEPLPAGSTAVTAMESLLQRSRQGPMAVAARYTKKLSEAIQVLAG